MLYSMPEIFGTKDYLRDVSRRDIQICEEESIFRDGFTCDPDIFELLVIYMAERHLMPPTDVQESLALYRTLRQIIIQDLYR